MRTKDFADNVALSLIAGSTLLAECTEITLFPPFKNTSIQSMFLFMEDATKKLIPLPSSLYASLIEIHEAISK